jgi:transglutaminase-like putative cysteine protease
MNRRLAAESALLAVAFIGAGSIARLAQGAPTWRGVLVTAFAGFVVGAVGARRLAATTTVMAGAVAVAVTSIWVSVPGATWYGVPTATTFRVLGHSLRAVGALHIPLAGGGGELLLCSVVAGMAAVATRLLPGVLGLLPTMALVAVSTVALPTEGAGLIAVLFAVAAGVVIVATGPGRAVSAMGTVTTVVAALGIGVVALITGPASASGGGRAVAGVPPTALSLVSRLTGLEIRDPHLVLFRAVTSVPTYWQVATLSVFEGQTWVPDSATAAALRGRSGPPPPASPIVAGSTFTTTVTIANLSSRLLPVPPSTIAVPSATLSSVGVVASGPTEPGQRYRATAPIPEPDGGAAAAATEPDATDGADTRLPTLPPSVTALARSVTATAASPLDKAEALTNWFRSDLFHYSLRAPPTSLVSFLTSSRTGTCEQFAGAYAVLARAIGLPTRVAVGFTSGVRDPAGQTVVRGIDAHVWPEVLLGGSWISFEPTPGRPAGELSPPGVIGLTAVGNPNPISLPTIPTSLPRTTVPLPTPPPATALPVTPAGRSGFRWWVPVAGGVVLLGLLTGFLAWRRRRRRTPAEQLVRAWKRVDRALEGGALARPPSSTPLAHTRLVRSRRPGQEMEVAWAELEWLARAVEEATYGQGGVDGHDAHEARLVSRRLTRALSSREST